MNAKNKNERVVIIGAGGHAKVVAEIFEDMGCEIVGFLDEHSALETHLGYKILGGDDMYAELLKSGVSNAFIGFAGFNTMQRRIELFRRLKSIGYKLPVCIHSSAVVSPRAEIGEGSCIMPRALVNSCSKIAENCIINSGSIVEHDAVIEAHSHICPGAVLAGGVTVGRASVVGAGATVIQGIRLGENSFVAAGATVIRDVAAGTTVAGVPAKPINR